MCRLVGVDDTMKCNKNQEVNFNTSKSLKYEGKYLYILLAGRGRILQLVVTAAVVFSIVLTNVKLVVEVAPVSCVLCANV